MFKINMINTTDEWTHLVIFSKIIKKSKKKIIMFKQEVKEFPSVAGCISTNRIYICQILFIKAVGNYAMVNKQNPLKPEN